MPIQQFDCSILKYSCHKKIRVICAIREHPKSYSVKKRMILLGCAAILFSSSSYAQQAKPAASVNLRQLFQSPPESAKSWVFWYWMQASVSKEGITADLEAMKEAGIGGAYLMPIKGPATPALYEPATVQLTPRWWEMLRHAFSEADRLGVKIAMHVSDGFALAGGPWIKPEESMQKLVWTETSVTGGKAFSGKLPQPETKENYYRDVSVVAYPAPATASFSTLRIKPQVSTSRGDTALQFLADTAATKQSLQSADAMWVQYAFAQPFTVRAITIRSSDGRNYYAHRMRVEASDDGVHFRTVAELEAPRHGWQDWDFGVSHSIAPVTAKYFRFHYDKKGVEPGSEDLDAAKWKPILKLRGIELSGTPKLHQYEGKSGAIWRVSKRTTDQQLGAADCVAPNQIIDLTSKLKADGSLQWTPPNGNWIVLRIGHTSTGHTNATGGGGKGLECDKFNPDAVAKQYTGWFGETIRQAGPELAKRVMQIFHVDSWECGSQNWSPIFRKEFQRRRGYDPLPLLPVMTGVPIGSVDASERFLYDVRQTISELVQDVFYATLKQKAHADGMTFSAESIAPTMLADGMQHFGAVDIPMGEFWLRSPTHDKPNDMLDAITAAHVYGKPLVQAEAYTQLRTMWDEHPGMIKGMGDLNYTKGINRMVYHVFTHNPWMNRKPGMTLDGIGLYFQRDQTWWKPGRAWQQYAQRVQALLQQGRPVADLAVFTGEELPRRSVLPDRLVPILPGVFGAEKVQSETARMNNDGQPQREMPIGVNASANITTPEQWVDPLHGYQYESFNPDILLHHTSVRNGKIVLKGSGEFGVLVVPGATLLNPNADRMSLAVVKKLHDLVQDGATVLLVGSGPKATLSGSDVAADRQLQLLAKRLWQASFRPVRTVDGATVLQANFGKGRILMGPYKAADFNHVGVAPDLQVKEGNRAVADVAWTHRTGDGFDIYFLSNQQERARTLSLSLRVAGRVPELWDPLTGTTEAARSWRKQNGRTILDVRLEPNASLFVVLQQPATMEGKQGGANWSAVQTVATIGCSWQVGFDTSVGGPAQSLVLDSLTDWSRHADSRVQHYSGTAVYRKQFTWSGAAGQQVWLDLGRVANLAEVIVNGKPCGIAWTYPFRVDISKALQQGSNMLEIGVTNTWANRIIGDQALPEAQRITHTNAPYRLKDKPLLPAGLLGPVTLQVSVQEATAKDRR